ncbi:MAG: hypothetical protein A2Y76_07265 [Planctomycetes bacterium RBG_13_60_9]|nr:MAG: hypothetical protein A2Y76_07265 [Planctomycetes bacterium RBG_13_60_9]
MNHPEAKKTQEGVEGKFCSDPEVFEVFFHPCIEVVKRNENNGRAKETRALPSPNYQPGALIADGSGS